MTRSTVAIASSPVRSVLALTVGYFLRDSLIRLGTATIMSLVPAAFPQGVPAPRGSVMILVWSGIAATFGGLATGIIAGRKEVGHAAFLAAIWFIMGVAGITLGHQRVSSNVALIVVNMCGAIIGGAFAARARRRRAARLGAMRTRSNLP